MIHWDERCYPEGTCMNTHNFETAPYQRAKLYAKLNTLLYCLADLSMENKSGQLNLLSTERPPFRLVQTTKE